MSFEVSTTTDRARNEHDTSTRAKRHQATIVAGMPVSVDGFVARPSDEVDRL
jgi:hypothetical protein